MSRQRKRLSGPEKLGILKKYLVEKVPISDLCDQHGLQPSQVYYWQAQLFEHGAAVFEHKSGRVEGRYVDSNDAALAALCTLLCTISLTKSRVSTQI
jgi:transposase-like protein